MPESCAAMISLAQTAILLAAAVVAVSVFRFARLSSILGYLVAGLVIGPWGLNLIGDVGRILQVSEFGIVLLLFIIGLELQPTRLWVMRRIVFGYGPAQVALCALLLGAGAWALGVPPIASAVIGFGLSLSSTPLVLQVLAERGQLKTQYGRGAFGILLFQDLAVLPALALLPMLAPSSSTHAASGSWWITLLKLLAVIAVVIVGGRLLLRPALRVVARIRVSEVFTAAALLTVIATALLANLAGLSMSLGAFLAGVLLADSEFRHELEADVEPFKGLLLGLFFMAVGMSANLALFVSHPFTVLGAVLALMVLKALLMYGLARVSGTGSEEAQRIAVLIAQGGEFAFVLFVAAQTAGILASETTEFLVLAVTVSMLLAPLSFIVHERLLERWLERTKPPEFDLIDGPGNPVIIAGYGRYGQIVSRVL